MSTRVLGFGWVLLVAVTTSAARADQPAPSAAERKRAECVQLVAEERWAELKKCAKELSASPDAPPGLAAQLGKQAKLELAATAISARFTAADKRGDLAAMAKAARQLPEESQYKPKISARWAAARDAFVREKTTAAAAAAAAGKCGALRKLAAQVRSYDPAAADEIAILACAAPGKKCTDAEEEKMQSVVDRAWAVFDTSPQEALLVFEKALASGSPCISATDAKGRVHFQKASYGVAKIACESGDRATAKRMLNLRRKALGPLATTPERCASFMSNE